MDVDVAAVERELPIYRTLLSAFSKRVQFISELMCNISAKNMAAHLQPLDSVIIASIKKRFKKDQVKLADPLNFDIALHLLVIDAIKLLK